MEDVDECSERVDACGDNEKCVNDLGGFSCKCIDGYVKKDGACVKGKFLKKDSMICTVKELQNHYSSNSNNLKGSEKCSLVKKIKT